MNDEEFARLEGCFKKAARDGNAIAEALKSLGRVNEVTRFVESYVRITMGPLLKEIQQSGCTVLGDGSIDIVRLKEEMRVRSETWGQPAA